MLQTHRLTPGRLNGRASFPQVDSLVIRLQVDSLVIRLQVDSLVIRLQVDSLVIRPS